MNATAKVRVEWVKQSDGFHRSVDGRFDLVETKGYWVAIDGELGRVFRHPFPEFCERWCDEQAETQPGE